MENYSDFDAPFLEGVRLLKIPVIENGAPAWPEKFPVEKIERLRRAAGMNKFSSQMMLLPVDLSEGRFDVGRLQFYDAELERVESNRMLAFSIAGKKIVRCSCWWDPSYGSPDGDSSVLALLFVDCEGRFYLHDIMYLRHSEGGGDRSAGEQCRCVAGFLRRYHVPAVYVESNGLGIFLPEFLRGELAAADVPAAVMGKNSKGSKALRILDAFDAVVSAGYLSVHSRVKATPWLSEFVEWTPDAKGRDDGLDAVASALSAEPFAMPATTLRRARIRPPRCGTFRIKSVFDV
ncbi:MAG: hypothetical protein LBO78_01755 [Rickettsiales bacterium]|jgi:hypothetical protein|nr:hypothetical protein [Rickettsiales bacterium]